LNMCLYQFKARLSSTTFNTISNHIRQKYGINLSITKHYLVENRLYRRLQHFGHASFEEYQKFIFSNEGKEELNLLCDYLSTNKTYFYREPNHFTFFNKILNQTHQPKHISIWSSACSTGDEAYTLSILFEDFKQLHPTHDLYCSILGTDISSRVLDKAKLAIYDHSHLQFLPTTYINRYFKKEEIGTSNTRYKLNNNVKKNVQFKRLNLIKDIFGMNTKFDFIFCRNVLIYFEHATKVKVCNDLIKKLNPGGYLILGHCEGMICKSPELTQVQPSIFQKL